MAEKTQTTQVATFQPARLPWHPIIQERFNVDKGQWKVLVEAVYPNAKTTDSVVMALAYCKARNLDPFKRPVHIVPIWDREKRCEVETIWQGIAEIRTTASRTRAYAGRDATVFGEDITAKVGEGQAAVEITFPEYAQVTVYRMVDGQRQAFYGPQVYWLETYAEKKGKAPNSMWQKRPRGQLDKCAEAAALRMAFPEELGDTFIDAEAGLIVQHGSGEAPMLNNPQRAERPTRADFQDPPQDTGQGNGGHQGPPEGAERENGGSASDVTNSEPEAQTQEQEGPSQDDLDYVEDICQRLHDCETSADMGQLMNAEAKTIAELEPALRKRIFNAQEGALKAIEKAAKQ